MAKILGISTPSAFKRAKSKAAKRQSTPESLAAMLLYEAGWHLSDSHENDDDHHSFRTTNQIFSHLFDALHFATVYVKSSEYRTQSVAIDRRYEYSDVEDRYIFIDFPRLIRIMIEADFERKRIECYILTLDKNLHLWKNYDFKFNVYFSDIDNFVAILKELNESLDQISAENDRLIGEELKKDKSKETVVATNEAIINAQAKLLGLEYNYYETSKLKNRLVVFHLNHFVYPRFRIDNVSPQTVTEYIEKVVALARALDDCPKGITFVNR